MKRNFELTTDVAKGSSVKIYNYHTLIFQAEYEYSRHTKAMKFYHT